MQNFTTQLKTFAKSIGIDLIGIAPAQPDEQGQKYLREFLKQNRHGQMHYLENDFLRTHPAQLLPNAQSVIVIAINYYREQTVAQRRSIQQQQADPHGRFARYAYGRDYHKVIKKLLKQLAQFIVSLSPQAVCKPCVDSSPLLEKAYAVQAGLGFIGKNTTLITPEFGSYVLLGELLTTLKLDFDSPKDGTCGTCTRCMDACPTNALIAPNTMDATRCISYLTIEHTRAACECAGNQGCVATPPCREAEIPPIPQEFHAKMDNWIFGCDICQEVCPYNKAFAKPLQLEAFREVKIAGLSMSLEEILAIETDEQFLEKFAGSPVMRTKRAGLQRNARIALKNGSFTKKTRS